MAKYMPKVGIVIISFNRFIVTKECVESLLKIDYPNFSIIVVDNNSLDISGEKIKETFPNVILLQSDFNRGFCGGNNLGIKYCIDAKFDYVLIINDDVIVEPDFLTILVNKGMSLPNSLHVVTGKILCYHDKKMIWYAGGELSSVQGIGKHWGRSKADSVQYNISCRVQYASGCLMLIKREVFETVGLFNEPIFAYLDDTEFCLRLRNANIHIFYEAEARIYHHITAGFGFQNYSPMYFYFSSRNRVLITTIFSYKVYLLLYSWFIALIKISIIAVYPALKSRLAKINAIILGTAEATKIVLKETQQFLFAHKNCHDIKKGTVS